jgi:3-oxoadipate enol-lactonase
MLTEVLPGVWQAGKQNAPNLVMLHGWGGTGPANFGVAVETLSREFFLTIIDLAEHGRGSRLNKSDLSIIDLADDVAEKMTLVGVRSATVVGYSLGGAVAQELWRSHRERVSALVLAATATRLCPTTIANIALHGWAATNLLAGPAWGALGAGARTLLRLGANRGFDTTNLSGVASHNGPAVQLLAREIATFNSTEWITDVDVPVGVLVCSGDRLVPTGRQHQLAMLTNAEKVIELPGGHLGFLRHPEMFAAALREVSKAVTHNKTLAQTAS